jgi:hypothetical protein
MGRKIAHVREMHRNYFWNTSETQPLQNLDIDGSIILRWILNKWDMLLLTQIIWLVVGSIGRILWTVNES